MDAESRLFSSTSLRFAALISPSNRVAVLHRERGAPAVSFAGIKMRIIATFFRGLSMVTSSFAQVVSFDQDTPGVAPKGWQCGRTGSGSARWQIEADASAPSKPHVLKQSDVATFAWCVRHGTVITDGFVEVKFKPIAGREDQAGGVVWRWKDGDNYYVARANALENNVSLYYTENGRRKTLKYVNRSGRGGEPGTRCASSSMVGESKCCTTESLTSNWRTTTSKVAERLVSGPRRTA